jgi:hypothetical protein
MPLFFHIAAGFRITLITLAMMTKLDSVLREQL